MNKRYLGGDIYFEQKETSQEFSEDNEGGGGSSTLSGLTDVDISDPTDRQMLVYNATSGKWVNGAGGGVHVIGTQAIEAETGLTVTAGQLYDWLQNGEYAVLRIKQNDNQGNFHPIAEYEFVEGDGYGFNFGGSWYAAVNADDYPVGVA